MQTSPPTREEETKQRANSLGGGGLPSHIFLILLFACSEREIERERERSPPLLCRSLVRSFFIIYISLLYSSIASPLFFSFSSFARVERQRNHLLYFSRTRERNVTI